MIPTQPQDLSTPRQMQSSMAIEDVIALVELALRSPHSLAEERWLRQIQQYINSNFQATQSPLPSQTFE